MSQRMTSSVGSADENPATLSPKALVLCAVGVFLLATDLDLSIGSWSFAPIFLGLGISLCVLGGSLLLARGGLGAPRQLIAALALVLIGAVLGELGALGSQIGSLAMIGAMLLFANLLRAFCRSKQWTAAVRSWTVFLATAWIVYGAATLLTGVAMMLTSNPGEPLHSVSNSFVALTIAWAVLAIPVVLLIRALAITASAARDDGPERAPRALRWAKHPALSVLVFILVLSPVWILIPSVIHFNTTPTFEEYLAAEVHLGTGPSLEDFLRIETPTSQTVEVQSGLDAALGDVLNDAEEEGEALAAAHRWMIRVVRGDSTLFELEHRLVARATPNGVRVAFETDRFGHDPRFHAVVQAAVEMPSDTPAEGRDASTWWFPFVTSVTLVSGPGEDRFALVQVDRLKEADALIATASRQRFSFGLKLAPLDDADEEPKKPAFGKPDVTGPGIRFAWHSRGVLGFSRSLDRQDSEEGAAHRARQRGKSWAQASYAINQEEYSFDMTAEHSVEFPWDERVTTTISQDWKRSIERTWNEVLW